METTATNAVKAMLSKARTGVETPMLKLRRIGEVYLERNDSAYTALHKDAIRRQLSATVFKFWLSHVHLEELWTHSLACRWQLLDLVENSVSKHTWDEDDRILGAKSLEAFLFQTRAFLDFYMRLICMVFTSNPPLRMSQNKFQNCMDKTQGTEFESRTDAIRLYFKDNVFGPGCWGTLVTSIRDKIAHSDSIRPNHESSESLHGVDLDWPTIQKMTMERFGQSIQNGTFDLIADSCADVFCLKWQSGPYRANAW